jgi:hypothetical protein
MISTIEPNRIKLFTFQVNAREETLALSESKAGLEREVNLLRLQVGHLQQAHQQSENKVGSFCFQYLGG